AAGRSPHEIRPRSGLVSAGSVRDDGRLPAGGAILAATSGPEDVSAPLGDGPLLLRGHASARTAHHSWDDDPGQLRLQVAGDPMACANCGEPAVSHPASG